jgi:hypothetical protein
MTCALQRLYICAITSGGKGWILNSELEVLSSFQVDGECDSFVHVFTKSNGLVRGGSSLIINSFDGWKPKPSRKLSTGFNKPDDCIITTINSEAPREEKKGIGTIMERSYITSRGIQSLTPLLLSASESLVYLLQATSPFSIGYHQGMLQLINAWRRFAENPCLTS